MAELKGDISKQTNFDCFEDLVSISKNSAKTLCQHVQFMELQIIQTLQRITPYSYIS